MLQHSVHIERLERLRSPPQRIMLHILMRTNVSRSKQLFLYTHIRLAQFFANYDSRLAAVYIRLAAFTCLSSLGLIASSTSSNGNNNNGSSGGIGHVFYAGLPDELVDILRLDPRTAAEPGVSHGVPNGDASPLASKARSAIYELIKTASLYALSEIAYTHPVTNRDGVVRDLVETLDAGSFHGFLPSFFRTLVQQTIDEAKATANALAATASSPPPAGAAPPAESSSSDVDSSRRHAVLLATFRLLSGLLHSSGQHTGASFTPLVDALISAGYIDSLLVLVACDQLDSHLIIHVIRILDAISNLDMQAFQSAGGLDCFLAKLEHLVDDCRREQPFMIRIERPSGVERGVSIDSSYLIQSPTIGTHGDTQMSSPQQSAAVVTTSSSTDQLAGAQAPESSSQTQQTTSASQALSPPVRPASPPSSGSTQSLTVLDVSGTSSQTTTCQQGGVEQMDTSSGAMGEPSTATLLAAPLPGVLCPPRRTQLIKVVLDFLKKCITDHVFADSVRHSMSLY
jgi:hypothetical protein